MPDQKPTPTTGTWHRPNLPPHLSASRLKNQQLNALTKHPCYADILSLIARYVELTDLPTSEDQEVWVLTALPATTAYLGNMRARLKGDLQFADPLQRLFALNGGVADALYGAHSTRDPLDVWIMILVQSAPRLRTLVASRSTDVCLATTRLAFKTTPHNVLVCHGVQTAQELLAEEAVARAASAYVDEKRRRRNLHLEYQNQGFVSAVLGVVTEAAFRSPEEETVWGVEGDVARVEVNWYERNPQNRQRCIEHWKAVCAVCGLDFGKRYGAIGDGFIHVHHLRPLSSVGRSHRVDPVKDLRPVCPNCHAMIHRCDPMLTIEQLRRRLRGHV